MFQRKEEVSRKEEEEKRRGERRLVRSMKYGKKESGTKERVPKA